MPEWWTKAMPPPREERGQMVQYPGDARWHVWLQHHEGAATIQRYKNRERKKSTLWSRMKSFMLEHFSSWPTERGLNWATVKNLEEADQVLPTLEETEIGLSKFTLFCACCITERWEVVFNTVMCLCFRLPPRRVCVRSNLSQTNAHVPQIKGQACWFHCQQLITCIPDTHTFTRLTCTEGTCWSPRHWNLPCCTCCRQARIVFNG